MRPVLIFYLYLHSVHCQFAEIASLATSLLGTGLGPALGGAASASSAGSAAGSALGALSQIGQCNSPLSISSVLNVNDVHLVDSRIMRCLVYQLAQGALQLTGTGVGVLNQASEGNWFPAVLEHASKNARALMTGHSGGIAGPPNLGALGPIGPGSPSSQIDPEFGTNFPAPSIEDYEDSSEKEDITTTTALADIDGDSDVDITTVTSRPSSSPIALFPEELTPDRVSAAKTLNAEIRTGVPNLSKLIDVLRKSKLKESEIMEIVSQVESNDNIVKSPKVDFTSAVQNIPLKQQKNRERIAKATRELQDNIEPQEKALHSAQKIHFTGTQQLPPLTQMEFTAKNPLQREASPIPIGKTPYPTPSPTLGTLSQGQYTTQPHYVLYNNWQQPLYNSLQSNMQSLPLYQPHHAIHSPLRYVFHHQYGQPQSQHLPTLLPQPYQIQQTTYSQQVQGRQQLQQFQQLPGLAAFNNQQQISQPYQHLQQLQPQQQQQQPLRQQPQQQRQIYQGVGQSYPYLYQKQPYNTDQRVGPWSQQYYQRQQQQPQPQARHPSSYRQAKQVSGQVYPLSSTTRHVVFTNQPAGTPPEYNQETNVALTAPIQHGNILIKLNTKPIMGPLTEAKAVSVSSEVTAISKQSAQRTTSAVFPRRRFPTRTIPTQRFSTTSTFRPVEADTSNKLR
ncbi:unnamed protein product [Angiostrongylus costaricensis]|uniref:Uncharacterized protein n=1 Tax=Angiostrongylus costaricensis TaxID=334426 RepID=A0A158PFA1_ANGCS|nr:unnamed protein product [Angiostrongylus costaricensis]